MDLLVVNDDSVESIYIRVFWCGPDAPETVGNATTDSLEIKGGKSRAVNYTQGENGTLSRPGYCAMSLIGPAAGAAVRVEGK